MGRNLLNVCVGVRVTKSQPSHSISVLPPSHTRREAIPRRQREPQVASRDRETESDTPSSDADTAYESNCDALACYMYWSFT